MEAIYILRKESSSVSFLPVLASHQALARISKKFGERAFLRSLHLREFSGRFRQSEMFPKDFLTSAFNLNKHVFNEITHFSQPKVQYHPNSNRSFDK